MISLFKEKKKKSGDKNHKIVYQITFFELHKSESFEFWYDFLLLLWRT